MTSTLEIREPHHSDAPALTELLNLPGVRAGTLRMPFAGENLVVRRLEPDPNMHAIVGVLEGTPVAWASLVRRTGRAAHVGDIGLSVHDAQTGRGIGRAMLAALVDLADDWLGLRRLQLEVTTDNARTIRLYEGQGFAHEGTLRGDTLRDGALIDSYVMARLHPAPAFASESGEAGAYRVFG